MRKSLEEQLERIKILTYGKQINEDNLIKLVDSKFSNIKYNMDGIQNDLISSSLISDIQTAAQEANVIVTITKAKTGHSKQTKTNNLSRHTRGMAVDISVINGKPVLTNKVDTNNFVKGLTRLGYILNRESGNQKSVLSYGFKGHENHVHISNNS